MLLTPGDVLGCFHALPEFRSNFCPRAPLGPASSRRRAFARQWFRGFDAQQSDAQRQRHRRGCRGLIQDLEGVRSGARTGLGVSARARGLLMLVVVNAVFGRRGGTLVGR